MSSKNFVVQVYNKYNGLNDTVGGVVAAYHQNKHIANFKIEVISPSYFDISKYVDLSPKVVFFKSTEEASPADVIFPGNDGSKILEFSHNEIKEVFNVKQEILNKALQYSSYIGVHFRHQMIEINYGKDREKEFEEYKNNFFNKVYSEEKLFLIVSDFCEWANIFKEYSNIVCLLPQESISDGNKVNNRAKYLELTLHSLCCLASCKEIIKTKGNFTHLLKLFLEKDKKTQRLHDNITI